MLMRALHWFFRDRRTGRIVVAQWPNLPLWIFVVAEVVELVVGSAGAVGTGAGIVAVAALVIWAGDELLRGVNPWRRCLGAAVLIGEAARLLRLL
jgi:hypothetical protein